MANFKVVKGRDGRQCEMITEADVSEHIFQMLSSKSLLSCEKLITAPITDLLDKLNIPLSELESLKDTACSKVCPPIHKASEITYVTFSFGSRKMDHAFGSILSAGKLLEIWGASGTGKTQLALQICASLDPQYCSAYISTEGNVPTGRLLDLCKARGSDSANCDIKMCNTVDEFVECIMKQLPLLLSSKNVRIVVIDSIAAPFRAGEVDGGGVRRAQKIRAIGQQLKYIAVTFNVAVVVLNQATDNPLTGKHPALGLTWSYLINSRLKLERVGFENEGTLRQISVEKASCLKLGTSIECAMYDVGIV